MLASISPCTRAHAILTPLKVVNVRAPFLLTQAFLASLPSPKSTPAAIINLNSILSFQTTSGLNAYSSAKAALLAFTAHVANDYPNVTAVTLNPGLVDTDTLQDMFRRFDLNTPQLVGGVAVWLSCDPERSRFLSGRFVIADWCVDDLVERKEEIVEKGLLKIDIVGTLGREQLGE